jgi:two-component system LytT family response regulator
VQEVIKTIIVDDESDAREAIKMLLGSFPNDLLLVAEGFSVKTGVEAIIKYEPDLVFLDIDMPDGTGFDLLQQLPNRNFQLIFVTGSNDSAIRAFRFNAIDYILKPINPDELIEATEKAVQTLDKQNNQSRVDNLLKENQSELAQNIVLSTQEDIFLIEISTIIRCQSEGNYTTFYINTGQKILVSKNIKEYADLLSKHSFYRVHQSHLINIDYFARYHKKDGGYIIMKDQSEVPLSKRKKEAFLLRILQL